MAWNNTSEHADLVNKMKKIIKTFLMEKNVDLANGWKIPFKTPAPAMIEELNKIL